MKCPLCNTEMRIVRSSYVLRGTSLSKKLSFSCFNKDCSNYRKDVASTYIPLEVSEEESAE